MSLFDEINAAGRAVADRADDRIATLTTQLATANAATTAARAEVVTLTAQVASAVAAAETSARDRAAALAEVTRVTGLLETAQASLASCQSQRTALQSQLTAATAEAATLRASLTTAQQETTAARAQVATLQSQLATQATTLTACQAVRAALVEQVAALQARLDELEPPATRDPMVQPLTSDAWVNLARPKTATLGTASHPMAVALRSVKGGFNRGTFAVPINRVYRDTPTAPLKIVEVPEGGWRPAATDKVWTVEAPLSLKLAGELRVFAPIYASSGALEFGLDPSGNSGKPDAAFVLWYEATGEYLEGYKVVPHPTEPRTLLARRGSVKVGSLRGDGLTPAGTRASRFPVWLGAVTDDDLASGTIDHKLVLGLRKEQIRAVGDGVGAFVPPASGQDSAAGYTGVIPFGQEFYIPDSVNLDTLGLSPVGLMVGRALQKYGAVPGDTAGWTVIYFEDGPVTQAITDGKNDWQTKLLPLVVSRTDVVTWDNLTTGERVLPRLASLAPLPS